MEHIFDPRKQEMLASRFLGGRNHMGANNSSTTGSTMNSPSATMNTNNTFENKDPVSNEMSTVPVSTTNEKEEAATLAIGGKTFSNWQMEVLMEKLRSKAGTLKPYPVQAKMVKQAVMNKQHCMDNNEKAVMGQCLDTLRKNIKVTTLPAMIERLEATAKQLGLKFTGGTSILEVYVSCDMFYVEVLLDADGKVRDVKVELAGDKNKECQSSPELIECLSKGDFTDFTEHLEGFLSIYQLNAEKHSKLKAFQALQALETDLSKLFEMAQETISDVYKQVLKSPTGLLIKRRGGHAMKLVYFISPYELLDVNNARSMSLTQDVVTNGDFSNYVTVNIEASTSHKLQTTTLMNVTKGIDGKKLPSFSGLTTTNSITLPARFSLNLKKPIPLSLVLAQRICEVTGIDFFDVTNQQPLLDLIIKQVSESQLECNNNRGLFVTLPDQQHCYFMTSGSDFPGVMVSGIPFTHPTHISSILVFLRTQAAFNTLITSCIRPASKQDLESAFMFEVTAVSHEYITVTFEHPQEESTATVEIDITDLSNMKCHLHTLKSDSAFCSDEYATKVLQRCLSIPITMRAVMRKVTKEERKDPMPGGDSVVMTGGGKLPSDLNQNTKFLLNDFDTKVGGCRDQLVNNHMGNLNNVVANSATHGHNYFPNSFAQKTEKGANPMSTVAGAGSDNNMSIGYGGLVGPVSQKASMAPSFLGDAKTAKVRKRKSIMEMDRKNQKFDEVVDLDDRSSDSFMSDSSAESSKRRDIKLEKLPTSTSKRRASDDAMATDAGTSELAALREKVYGPAGNFNKIRYISKDTKDLKKIKKPRIDESNNQRKSPIVLDLTEAEATAKKGSSTSSSQSSSSTLSAALLKRPGIEIIPIPGSNTPISIPSSITVTPVMKSSDDKYKDKKDKRDKKDFDKKDKKRRREDSPGSTGSSSSTSSTMSSASSGSKPSKVQIISSNHQKHSSLSSSIEKFKSESHSKSSLSGVTVKQSTPPYQSPKKSTLSPTMSKSMITNKVPFSPTHKPNKLIYSPTQNSSSSSSPKSSNSPKPSGSPKHHPSMSPKHTSMGKPSMNTLKSASPTFSKPSLSPKLAKSKDKERIYSSSPSRPTSTSSMTSLNSSTSTSSASLSKPKVSSSSAPSVSSASASSSDKIKQSVSDALTITKVSTESSSSISSSFLTASQTHTTTTQSLDKSSINLDKSKVSPPKNRKGSSLIDIVDKLRAGAGVGSDQLTIIEKKEKEKKEMPKPASTDLKKDADKKTEFTIKPSVGLKFTIKNQTKVKESNPIKSTASSTTVSSSLAQSSKGTISKSPSGLKPAVMGGSQSKKVSMSSLPPIPKLPPSSVSNVTATAISPLGAASLPMIHSSPLQYQRERSKDKEQRTIPERTKTKDTLQDVRSALQSMSSLSSKKESNEKPPLVKQSSKEDYRSTQPVRKPEAQEAVEKAMNLLRSSERTSPIEKLKSEHDLLTENFPDKALTDGLIGSLAKIQGTSTISSSAAEAQRLREIFGDMSGFKANETKDDKSSDASQRLSSSHFTSQTSVSSDTTSKTDSSSNHTTGMSAPPPPTSLMSSHSSIKSSDHKDGPGSKSDQSDKSKNDGLSMSTSLPISSCPGNMPPISSHSKSSNSNIGYPQSPSVQIKIVKSPAPVSSPLNMISPHSVTSQHSPCIIEDDMMEETFMCSRK